MQPVTIQEVIDALESGRHEWDQLRGVLAYRIRTYGIAPPDGYALVPKNRFKFLSEKLDKAMLAAAPKQENSNE